MPASEVYFVIFAQQDMGKNRLGISEYAGNKVVEEPFEANFIKIESNSQAEAKEAIMRHFPGDLQTTPIAVKEAAWKSS